MLRTFLGWDAPALPTAARHLVDAHLRTGPPGEPSSDGLGVADLSRATVVVPGSRAGRRLEELLLAEAEDRDIALLPPRTVTVGALPLLLHAPGHPTTSPPIRHLVWARALQAVPRAELSTLFARLPDPDEPLTAWRGLAREVSDLARAVSAGGFSFADVARRCRAPSGPDFDDGARWGVLARVQGEYRRRLDELALADAEVERIRALADGDVHLPGPIWLVGVAELPAVTARMLRTAAAATGAPPLHALVHAPRERAGHFDDLGLLRPDAWVREHPPLSDAAISVVDDPRAQAREVARILARDAAGRRTDEVVIGVPQPDLVPQLAEQLGRSGVRVRDAAGTPLHRTGPWRLVAALAEVVGERSRESVAGLLRHPDLSPWLRDATGHGVEETLAALDRWSARHLPARMVAPYPGVDRTGEAGDDARRVADVVGRLDGGLLRELGARRALGDHMGPVLAALDRIYGPHAPDDGTPTGHRVLHGLDGLRETARALGSLPDELNVVCSGADALRLLLDESAGARVPEPADAGAVELVGWLEVHLDDAPVTVVTGVNEGTLPETVRGDAFLPDALRRHLGLEDNRRRLARDLYRLTAMLHSRPVLHLVGGRRSEEGNPLRPSRLLFAADDATVARRVRRFYEGSGDDVPAPPAAPEEPRTSAFVLPPEPVLQLDPFPTTLSPTDFRALLDDPYRWALRRLRGPRGAGRPALEPIDDSAVELDGAAFGDLAHVVLERFGQEELARHRRGEAGTDPGPMVRRLDDLLDALTRARFGPNTRVAVRLQVEQLRARLRAFAERHAARVGEGWRIAAVEVRAPGAGVPLGTTPPVGLRGTIDRIDHHPAQGWAVLDYKTADAGDDPTSTHIRNGTRGIRGAETEWKDLQLPLYRWLAPRLDGLPITGVDAEEIAVGYVLLPRTTEGVGVAMAEWDAATLDAGVETARALVASLARGVVGYDAAARPAYPDDPRLAALLGRSVLGGEPDEDEEGPA